MHDNLHDFFNDLVWPHLSQAKRRMNRLHAQALVATRCWNNWFIQENHSQRTSIKREKLSKI